MRTYSLVGQPMGPLLFSIYVNNLPTVIQHSTVNIYADDITIYTSHHDPAVVSNSLCSDLARVACWIDSNGLKMNISKTQMMVMSKKENSTNRLKKFVFTLKEKRSRSKM